MIYGYNFCQCGSKKRNIAKTCMACRGPQTPGLPIGNRRLDGDGYWKIKVGHGNHPRAHLGWIREHTLVLEKKIGRYLLPNENAHHINGIRTDNHPDNLELWIRKQPQGMRVEDMLSWAEEIISTYGGHSVEIGMVMC